MKTTTSPSAFELERDTPHLILIHAKATSGGNGGRRLKLSLPRWDNKTRILPHDHAHPAQVLSQALIAMHEAGIPIAAHADAGKTWEWVLLVSFDHAEAVLKFFRVPQI